MLSLPAAHQRLARYERKLGPNRTRPPLRTINVSPGFVESAVSSPEFVLNSDILFDTKDPVLAIAFQHLQRFTFDAIPTIRSTLQHEFPAMEMYHAIALTSSMNIKLHLSELLKNVDDTG